MSNKLLCITSLSKSFPGVKALDGISFDVIKGTIHALVGENGAGKSTLIQILAGILKREDGCILLDGQEVVFKNPQESQKAGISVVHQELKLVDPLSVTENIFLGKYLYNHGIIDWKRMKDEARRMIAMLEIDIDVDANVETLTVAKKQIVEVCKAINQECDLIIMDEPSATLTEKELDILFDVIFKLKERGITIIYISHRLEEIFKIADNVTVIRDGSHINTLPVNQVDRDSLISMICGRSLVNEYPKEIADIGDISLKVMNLTREGVLNNISFEARSGEVLGIAGLVGAGRTELARAILGIDPIDSGSIYLHGQERKFNKFKKAIDSSLGLVPEDRKSQGLILPFSVKQNISLVNIDKIIKKGVIQGKLEDEVAREYVELLNIATSSIETEVRTLSGGNQQKVVIAKWLMQDSEVIFLDEPTRGVDVGAKVEIYKIINELVRKGKTVIMISSELPEILGMCDRVLVMHEGSLVGELSRDEATQEGIISLCV